MTNQTPQTVTDILKSHIAQLEAATTSLKAISDSLGLPQILAKQGSHTEDGSLQSMIGTVIYLAELVGSLGNHISNEVADSAKGGK